MWLNKELWRIDMHVLPLKVHYFLFFTALAAVFPFRTVFAKQLGISATAVGIIFLATPFLKIISNPFFGVIVDYFKRIRLTLMLTMVVIAVSHVSMLYIPPLHKTDAHEEVDLQVRIKYHYFEDTLFNKQNVSYIEIFSQLESKLGNDLKEVSCEITCNSDSLLVRTEESLECANSVSLKSKLNLKVGNCFSEHLFADETVVTRKKQTENMAKLGKKVFDFLEPFKKEQNCSVFNQMNTKQRKLNPPNAKISLEDLKLTGSISKDFKFKANLENSSTIKSHELFALENDDLNVRSLSCQKWLPCTVENYSVNNLKVDMVPIDEYLSSTYWILFILVLISSVCCSVVTFLVDAACYEMVDHKEKYGIQRLWGTVGWGFGALIGGYLNQLISTDDSITDYTLSFYLLTLLTIIGLIPVYKIEVKDLKYSPNICKDVCFIFSNVHLLINIFMVFAIGVISGLIWNYQFWFMQEIGSSQVLLGLSQIFECWFSELPCFIISGWVIRKIGYAHCNNLTFVCFGLRYLGFAYMQDPWMSLPVALFYGPTFGIFFASMTMYGKSEAPPGTEATVQSILSVAFEGIGCGTGSILGGIGFDMLGSRKTFLYTAIACFILLVFNVLLHLFVPNPKKKMSEKGKLPSVDAVSFPTYN